MCVRYYGESAVCCRLAKGVLFVATRVCPWRVAIARSRDQVEIDQKREYISVNGKAAFSSLQTMW